jgi:hypothetical protein
VIAILDKYNILDYLLDVKICMHKLSAPSLQYLGYMLISLKAQFSSERRVRNTWMLSPLDVLQTLTTNQLAQRSRM